MSTVREELEKAVGMKQKKGQDDQVFMKKLAEAVDGKLGDDEFDSLSDEAQAWQNEAVEAMGAGDDLPDFPEEGKKSKKKAEKPAKKGKAKKVEEEEEEEEEEAEEEVEEEEEEEEKPKKGKAKAKKVVEEEEEEEEEEEKPKKKAAKAEKPKKKVKTGMGDSTKILHIICDNDDKEVSGIIKIAEKKGMSLSDSTIKIRYYITHEILKYLKENKRLKG